MSLPASGRLLATGDLHDNPEHLQKIIALARLETPDHHLVLHEIVHSDHLVNGLDLSHRMLARVAELLLEYPHQVHVLLANHELAQMTGQGVSKGAGNSVVLFDAGLEFAYGDEWLAVAEAIKRFVRAMPLAARSESGVFCAHSLPAPAAMDRFEARNRRTAERSLLVLGLEPPSTAPGSLPLEVAPRTARSHRWLGNRLAGRK